MEDAVTIDDLKSPKTLAQKLFSRDSIPTVYAAFSALGFIGALKDISNLAHFLLSRFDGAIASLAGFINRLVPLPFGIEITKSMILYSGAVVFGLGGLFALFRREKIFRNELEVYLTLLCILIMSVAFASKLDDLDYSIIYEGNWLGMGAGYLLIAFISYVILRHGLKVPQFVAYLLSGTVLPPLIPTVFFTIAYGRPGVFPQIFSIFLLMTVLLGLFALNPKRLRQITVFILFFASLALVSVPLNAALPRPESTPTVELGE